MPRCLNACRDRSLDRPPCLALRVDGHRPRESGAATSTGRPAWPRAPTPALALGSDPLGVAVAGVGELAIQSRHRAAGHGARLAPPRLPALLAVEVEDRPGRPPAARCRAAPADPTDGAGEPTWGRRRIQAELALLGDEVAELT